MIKSFNLEGSRLDKFVELWPNKVEVRYADTSLHVHAVLCGVLVLMYPLDTFSISETL